MIRSCAPIAALVGLTLITTYPVSAQRPTRPAPARDTTSRPAVSADAIGGLRARSIGPAMTSGRVMSIAVHPTDPAIMYIGTASGGLWKSVSGGASWTSVMDREGSYSIGWVTLDPQNPNVVWAGTGERNSQRSVAYGDGVYKSDDGGRSWKNTGLKNSEHIGRLIVHPKNSDIVYVAAQGPLWSAGGDRGLFKTTDGGKTWENVLKISEHTGVSDVVMDPRNPDVLVATAYQRRRHFFTLIDGGPESAIHRTTDGGKTWTKVNTGLPNEELGRIGLAISPQNPDVLYAVVEAANRRGGMYRSSDNGVTWEKRMDYNQGSMYYGDVFPDPHQFDRIYIPDVIFQVSDDGGRSMRALGQRSMHVDNHAIWVDPVNPNHYLVGNDGGLYRSWDRGATWTFFENLPLAQYYDVDTDNARPFYNVYGGLQDNNSLGMPSRTKSEHGILNEDVFVTQGGDGFVSRVDPEDDNTIYAEMQHGVIVRYDKRTGERIGIQPQEEKGGVPLRWNWDAPFVISPHHSKRLYIAAQFVFRSDDRGNTWRKVSADLTRQVDRNRLPVMGKLWGPDAVAKNTSTAIYSNISAVQESPKKEGLLWVGTDDGLVQVSEDGGTTWRKIDVFPGVPGDAYVTRIRPSEHDANVAYATFSNHQNGDFKPYALRTSDLGRTWTSINGDLPARGGTFAFAEDHVDPNLLFIGTEFSAYASKDRGQHWLKIPGVPTIKVADLAIQKREHDLVIGTFGRGIYIVDDYTPLRALNAQVIAANATLFPARDAPLYVQTQVYGGGRKAFQGEMLYSGDNPPYGAVFTYSLKDQLKTLKQKRTDAEKAAERAGQPFKYPSADELRAEASEEAPAIILTVMNEQGKAIRALTGPTARGMSRVAWDLRLPLHQLASTRPPTDEEELFGGGPAGPFVTPGKYSVTLSQRVGGVTSTLAGPVSFNVVADPTSPQVLAEHQARGRFQDQVQELRRQLTGVTELAAATNLRLDQIRRALDQTPSAPKVLGEQARAYLKRLADIQTELSGDRALGSRSDPTPSSINERVGSITSSMNRSLAGPTATSQEQFRIATELLGVEVGRLRQLVDTEIPALEREVEKAGAPYTAGRRVGGSPL
ncbi:MAG: glycosyl hydrolase [Cytophagaceae bacterium]|nr:glycosyl hydrolase [Gemmatimonadaceae bacterium]